MTTKIKYIAAPEQAGTYKEMNVKLMKIPPLFVNKTRKKGCQNVCKFTNISVTNQLIFTDTISNWYMMDFKKVNLKPYVYKH